VRSRPVPTHGASVSQDWRSPLQGDKSRAYMSCIHRLETAYSMFSVNLDEALGMRRTGKSSKAYQVLSVAPALCQLLADPLHSLLQTMSNHAKHFGITPNIAPLNSQNFQHPRSQRTALFNDLFSRVLLTRKSQFSYKLSALADLVEDLHSSFRSTAQDLAGGDSLYPERDWDLLDSVHYDLNTCLRETVVLLKSFLHALPEGQLSHFQAAVHDLCETPFYALSAHSHLAHRRIAFLKGQ
jgi:hypothetical protein